MYAVHSNFKTLCLIIAGYGVFAGRDFNEGETVFWTWKTIFFPMHMPAHLSPWNYVYGKNDTHTALPLGYGSVANHHEIPNVANVYDDEYHRNVVFMVCKHLHLHI